MVSLIYFSVIILPIIFFYCRINYVLSNFSPQLKEYLFQNPIDIVSARDLFQIDYPNDPIKWKIEGFRQQIGMYLADIEDRNNVLIVSIGDGLFERIACKTVCDEFKLNSCSLKLFENPNPQLLSNQIDLIIQCINELLEIPREFIIGSDETSFLCNDLYFDYNSDGYLCIFHWEKKDAEKLPPAEIIDLSCSECLHNGQLQDMIVKHQIDPSLVEKSTMEDSGPPYAPITPSKVSSQQVRNFDQTSKTFTPIATESIATQHSPDELTTAFSSILATSSSGMTARKPSLYSLEDNGSTSEESNLEEDEMSLFQIESEVIIQVSSNEISFRSDGIQSRNSDSSELSEMSVLGHHESPSMGDLSALSAIGSGEQIPCAEGKHRRMHSKESSMISVRASTTSVVKAVELEEVDLELK